MVWVALESAEKLAAEGASVEVVDLRTLVPLDREAVCASVQKTGKVLLLHEDTRTGGMAGELTATITETVWEHLDGPIVRVTAPDTPVPLRPIVGRSLPPQRRQSNRESPLAMAILVAWVNVGQAILAAAVFQPATSATVCRLTLALAVTRRA